MLQVLGKVAPESVLYRPSYNNNPPYGNYPPPGGGSTGASPGPGVFSEGGLFCGPEVGLLLAHVELLLDEEIPLEQVSHAKKKQQQLLSTL